MRVLGFLLVSLFLCACNKIPLYSDLTEQEANEVIAVLEIHQIPASKTAGQENRWIVSIPPDSMPLAMEKLTEVGLPRARLESMGEIFTRSGLVSSPSEERIRFIYALSQEISRTLMEMDGVISARVHIVLPNNDPLAEKIEPASAAVFIKYRPGFQVESASPAIKDLVMRSIEGLEFENISLTLSPAQNPYPNPPPRQIEDSSWMTAIDWRQVGIGAGIGALLLALGYFIYHLLTHRRSPPADAST